MPKVVIMSKGMMESQFSHSLMYDHHLNCAILFPHLTAFSHPFTPFTAFFPLWLLLPVSSIFLQIFITFSLHHFYYFSSSQSDILQVSSAFWGLQKRIISTQHYLSDISWPAESFYLCLKPLLFLHCSCIRFKTQSWSQTATTLPFHFTHQLLLDFPWLAFLTNYIYMTSNTKITKSCSLYIDEWPDRNATKTLQVILIMKSTGFY